MDNTALRRQRPLGLTDLFGEQAAAYAGLERTLIEQFERWGYQRVVLPTIGYDETLSTQASPRLREQLYRFFDRDGRALALRPDMTVPVARLVGTTLYDQPLPQRLYYAGQVFRYEQPQAGQRREFTQVGIELIGAASAEADAEAIAVAMEALRALDVDTFQINVGQVEFLKGILNGRGLSAEALSALEQAINRKSRVEIRRTLEAIELGGEAAEAVLALPGLCGGPDVIEQARRLTISPAAHRALDHLARVYELLALDGYAAHLILDLGEVRSMDYYTGVSFHGYVAGLGFHVLSGGRYDRLIGHFGPNLPAVGFAMSIERALRLLAQGGFASVNVDLMFALPGQSVRDVIADLERAAELGANQITAYPLFTFPYSAVGEHLRLTHVRLPNLRRRRAHYRAINDWCAAHGFERVSVWGFRRGAVPRYSSVTRDSYIGVGPGAGSHLADGFVLNTFDLDQWVQAACAGTGTVALRLPFTRALSGWWWLYWRLYDTRIPLAGLAAALGDDAPRARRLLKAAQLLGLAARGDDVIALTDAGAFWLHLAQNYFALYYVNTLWTQARREPWPRAVAI